MTDTELVEQFCREHPDKVIHCPGPVEGTLDINSSWFIKKQLKRNLHRLRKLQEEEKARAKEISQADDEK